MTIKIHFHTNTFWRVHKSWLYFILLCVSEPGDSVVKNPPADTGNMGSVPGSGRSPEEGNGNPLQCPCLENSMDRVALRIHGIAKESDMT